VRGRHGCHDARRGLCLSGAQAMRRALSYEGKRTVGPGVVNCDAGLSRGALTGVWLDVLVPRASWASGAESLNDAGVATPVYDLISSVSGWASGKGSVQSGRSLGGELHWHAPVPSVGGARVQNCLSQPLEAVKEDDAVVRLCHTVWCCVTMCRVVWYYASTCIRRLALWRAGRCGAVSLCVML
jgi:hypothetical protein